MQKKKENVNSLETLNLSFNIINVTDFINSEKTCQMEVYYIYKYREKKSNQSCN